MKIHRTINACFPRSGHRFLRTLCKTYFEGELVYRSNHNKEHSDIRHANYIKDHDLKLRSGGDGIPMSCDARYLVQFRHPLLCLQSYYEFYLKHDICQPSVASWLEFLVTNLAYWKRFINKWCLSEITKGYEVYRLNYDDLYSDTKTVLSEVVTFMTGEEADSDLIEKCSKYGKGEFFRYAEHQAEGKNRQTKPRTPTDFRFYGDYMADLERELAPYLEAMNIQERFGSELQALR